MFAWQKVDLCRWTETTLKQSATCSCYFRIYLVQFSLKKNYKFYVCYSITMFVSKNTACQKLYIFLEMG